MDTHLENSDDDVTLSPDSVDSEHSLSDDSPETLDVLDDSYTVPEVYINVHDMADPSDSSLWVDAKSDDDDDDGNLICPSPINSYSVYSYRSWSYKWGEPWPAFDTIRPWNSCSPVWYEEKPALVGAGLSNLGNTCFLNAIVQCFTHTVPLVEGVRTFDHVTPCDLNINGFCLICAFRGHLEISLGSTERFVSPWKLVDNLSYFSSSFQRYQQEDAHEFLQCFLDRLESSCSGSMSKEVISCEEKDNFVKQVFGGRLVSKLKCCNCGHVSDTYEPSIDLSLEIKDVTTLQAALESFTKLEKIEDPETKFTCENCKEEVSIEKQLLLEETPSVAAFHLKRFKNDGSYVEKIDKFVEFPVELDLQPYTNSSRSDAELRFNLYAIVVHDGFFATSGHYYCFIRSSPDTWYKFDDSKVFRVQEADVLFQDAYILFYAKQGTPWFSTYLETIKPLLDPQSSNTSPNDAALDNILESPSRSRDDQVDSINYKDDTQQMSTTLPLGATSPIDDSEYEIKDKNVTPGVSTTWPPGTSTSLKDNCEGTKEFSPSVLQDCSLNQDDVRSNDDNPQTPPRSSSPDINRDLSGDDKSYSEPNHHQLVNQVPTKKPLQKGLESSETKAAQRFLKSLPGARRKSLSAAMSGSLSEDSQMNKRRKVMEASPNRDDRKASLRSLVRPLAAGCFR
ncbi:Ubiquitin carboxyl-terminal hydrolase [Heracleum sosnowskyi]|uniref:Ubiquitin carboxyl-terminal hydrolase n=1 Tax=Heracleum sosnowskyi TaxID=360622 RepID=A0AAD8HYT4_9APIA|nr:Ubiquitin carboxyl-terminal hydrolase [Heracleum sosnowskyi]